MRYVILLLLVLVSGCTGMLLGGRSSSMHSERTSAATSADSTITASVSRRLVADSQLGRYGLKVETLNGRVTLRGTVDTYAARERAASLTREVTGVVSVNNRVAVHQFH